MDVDSKQLRAFLAVADYRHFGRAAEHLGIAPSALSAQVRRLEDLLGGALLTRGRRSAVALTPAGEVFQAEAAAVIGRLARAERIGRLAMGGAAGTMEIGYVFSAAVSGVLSRLVALATATLPEIALTAKPMDTPEQIAALVDARIDAALIRPRRSYPGDVTARVVHSEPLLLALAADHPLAGAETIAVGDLRGATFLIPQADETDGLAAAVGDLATVGRFPTPTTRDTSDFVTAISIAAAGDTVVLAPRSLARLAIHTIRYRPIAGFDRSVDLALAWRGREEAPVAKLARALARDLGGRA